LGSIYTVLRQIGLRCEFHFVYNHQKVTSAKKILPTQDFIGHRVTNELLTLFCMKIAYVANAKLAFMLSFSDSDYNKNCLNCTLLYVFNCEKCTKNQLIFYCYCRKYCVLL